MSSERRVLIQTNEVWKRRNTQREEKNVQNSNRIDFSFAHFAKYGIFYVKPQIVMQIHTIQRDYFRTIRIFVIRCRFSFSAHLCGAAHQTLCVIRIRIWFVFAMYINLLTLNFRPMLFVCFSIIIRINVIFKPQTHSLSTQR